MTFVSYAQNFEDVMLWRALKDIDKGFYIDVGANDPIIESITKAFYDRGWNGINIEPLPNHWNDLVKSRPRDINLKCAAGEMHGELELWEPDVRGWATASRMAITIHQNEGYRGVSRKVPVFTLAEICAEHAPENIHFLKIDVEGLEKEVISGMDFSLFRPWIVVVEATLPNSPRESFQQWDPLIVSEGYTFAYCDGLNRFYVANERSERLVYFRYPPNVFDNIVLSREIDLVRTSQQSAAKAQESEARAQESEARARQAAADAVNWHQQAEKWHMQVIALCNSTSWRITKPLRGVKRLLCRDDSLLQLSRIAIVLRSKKAFRPVVAGGIRFVYRRPALHANISRVVRKMPWLHRRLLRVAINTNVVSPPIALTVIGEIADRDRATSMSRRGYEIFSELKEVADKQRLKGHNA